MEVLYEETKNDVRLVVVKYNENDIFDFNNYDILYELQHDNCRCSFGCDQCPFTSDDEEVCTFTTLARYTDPEFALLKDQYPEYFI